MKKKHHRLRRRRRRWNYLFSITIFSISIWFYD